MIRLISCFRRAVFSLIALSIFSAAAAYGLGTQPENNARTTSNNWTLVWSDEFNGSDGSMPDPGKWTIIKSGSDFGNRELEYYTDRPTNLHLEKGNLVITARKESYTGSDGVTKQYTSARLQTAGHFEKKYGRFEARIKVPKGQGIWPAFWMLGSDHDSTGWPECGEIDIMENVGFEPTKVHGSLHGPGYSGSNPLTGLFALPSGANFSDDFHVFAIEWEPGTIRFYVDDTLYETQTSSVLPSNTRWSFDHPFYVILDLAVGGNWPGNPDATTPFPVSMQVDYVRVYEHKDDQVKKTDQKAER